MNTLAGSRRRNGTRTAAVLLLLLSFSLATGVVTAQEQSSAVARSGAQAVDNVWVDVPLTQVLRDVAMQAGVTIAVDPSVPDRLVSLDADGTPLEECLARITAGQGLAVRKIEEGFYLVGSVRPGSPSFTQLADSQHIYLKYISARHLMECLPRELQSYVTSGQRAAEVLVFAPPEQTQRILEIIRQLDIPRRQVVLEALVLELSQEAGRQLGIDWERSGRDTRFTINESAETFTGLMRFTSIDERSFRLLLINLRMLVRDGQATIRSRPRVATLNGEKATIEVSLEEYFTILTDMNSAFLRTELQVIKSGVNLEMTPQIGEDGDITVSVATEVSDVASRPGNVTNSNGVAGTLPVVRRRKAETQVRVKEGDAIVIGGLVECQERTEVKRVPILGSIPLLGGLFRSKTTSIIEKEVVIFITPSLMAEGESPLADRHKLLNVEQELENLRKRTPTPSEGTGGPSAPGESEESPVR